MNCKECGFNLGNAGMVSGTYTWGQWSNARQGNYCYKHQEDPLTRRMKIAGGFLGWFITPFLYLLPFVLLFLVLRFA